MRDSSTPLRRGYWLALNGNLTVDATVIPVFDGKVEGAITQDLYVIFQEQRSAPKNSMRHTAEERVITMDIKKRMPSSVSSEDVDDVADQILQIVKPSQTTIGISIASPFIIVLIKLEDNDNNRPQDAPGNDFIISKSLRFRNHIIQN